MRAAEKSRRGEALAATQAAKLDEVFRGRTFEIEREIHLPPGQCFVTIFGNKGRHGFIIRDRASGERLVVGWTVLKHIHDRWLGVNLPPQPRRTAGSRWSGAATG